MPNLHEYRLWSAQNDLQLFMMIVGGVFIVGVLILSPRVKITPLWIVLGVAIFARFVHLGQSLWYDETFTSAITRLEFDQIHRVLISDVHPPLMYLPQWVSVRLLGFMPTDIALRLPSLIFGVLGVYVVYRLAIHWGFNPLWAGLLVAMHAGAINYSVEARGYSLLSLLVLCGVWGLVKQKPAYFLLMALAPLTHATGYVYLALLAPFALYRRWFVTLIIVGVISAFWLPIMMYQSHDVADGFWLGFTGYNMGQYLISWVNWTMQMPPAPLLFGIIIGGGVMVWALVKVRWNALWGILVVGAPLALGAISVFWQPVFLLRALLPSSQLMVLSLANRPVLRGVALVIMSMGWFYQFVPQYQRFDIRGAIAHCEGAKWIYATDTAMTIQALHYAPQRVITFYPPDNLHQTLSHDAKKALGFMYLPFDLLDGDVCVIHQNTPMTISAQSQFIEGLGWDYITVKDATFFEFRIYRGNNG